MDPEDSPMKGAVVIVHKVHEGKHHYGVEKLVKYKNARGAKSFARQGDVLMEINDMDLQNVTPEELAQILAEGNSKLTVHKTKKVKGHTELPSLDEDALLLVSSDSVLLSFSMELWREEENEVGEEGGGKEDLDIEDDSCKGKNEENGDTIIVSMTKTSISVVSGRGCDNEDSCPECRGNVCSVNDVITVAESSTVVLEQITIYYYKSVTDSSRGLPVVLNLTGSNCYLRCCKQGQTVLLQLEPCDGQSLRRIPTSDESTLAFVFYMKGQRTGERKFESALHLGWFIKINDTDQVKMETPEEGKGDHSFFFIIQK